MSRSQWMRGGAWCVTAVVTTLSLLACQGMPDELVEPVPAAEPVELPAEPSSGSGGVPEPAPSAETQTPGTQTPETQPPIVSPPPPAHPETGPGAPPVARWSPKPGTSWQIQFTGTPDLSVKVQAFDLDLFDTPVSRIRELQARGTKVICYFSAGTQEDWRPDARDFPASVLGNPLDGWPGERWLDIRSPQVIEVMKRRMDLAVQKGCDALDLDNMDSFTNDPGINLTPEDQLRYNRVMAAEAHARGLAIGLKNDLRQIRELVDHYDFSINESCFRYNECELLLPFIQAGKAVFNIEYTGSNICGRANALGFDTVMKNRSLDAARTPCR